MANGRTEINRERCKGCGVCIGACPTSVLALSNDVNGKGYNFAVAVNEDKCTGCANCALVCPDSCIEVWRS